MSYAAFAQATTNNQTVQALIVPAPDNGTYLFTRVTTGGRGASARWEAVTEEVFDHTPLYLDREPSAVKVTENDRTQLAERGIPSTLAVKAQSANEKAGPGNGVLLTEFVAEALVKVAHQSPDLADWYRDNRGSRGLSRPVVVTPTTTNAPAPVPAAPPAAPVAQPEPVPSMYMAVTPEKEIAKRYVHRKVYGQDDFAIFDQAMAEGKNVLIQGPTGAAKTMSAQAYAAARGLRYFKISGSIAFEVSQAFGKIMLAPDGSTYWQDGGLTECVRHGNAVIILDEVNIFPGKMITPLYPLLDDNRSITLLDNKGETIKAAPNLLIIATMNPGYLGTQPLSPALKNRFDYKLNWGYEEAVEKTLVPSKALRELATQLRAAEAAQTIFSPTPTNALMDLLSMAKTFDLDFAIANFLAGYDESEQASVKLAIDNHRSNIETDLGIAPATPVETDEVAPEGEQVTLDNPLGSTPLVGTFNSTPANATVGSYSN